jgi:phosphoribosylanthranilate isomerase
MNPLERFLDPRTVSLKVCGVTRGGDAERLAALGVDAIGVNFWSHSKRYVPAPEALWLRDLGGHILRVGVFVNEDSDLPLELFEAGLLDLIQLHGDESPEDAARFHSAGVPLIKALGVRTRADLARAEDFGAAAVLLDAHAPGTYGGTGEVFDWGLAVDFKRDHPEVPLVLAGGIVPENAGLAAATVAPAALDVASGVEASPGVKDFTKVNALIAAIEKSA